MEQISGQPAVDLIINSYIGNETGLKLLTDKNNGELLAKVRHELGELDPTQTTQLTRTLIDGLGTEDKIWDQDRRDGALELLKVVDFSKVDVRDIAHAYSDRVAAQGKDADPYGTISSLLDAGRVIAPNIFVDARERNEMLGAWTTVARHFAGTEDERFVRQEAGKIDLLFKPEPAPQPEKVANTKVETEGELEDFLKAKGIEVIDTETLLKKKVEFLEKKYIDVAQKNGNFKFTLWENSERFRNTSAKFGVKLENFWNFSDPDSVAKAYEETKNLAPLSRRYLAIAVKQKTGLDIEELTDDHVRIYADEITRAAHIASKNLEHGIGGFDDVLARLKRLSAESQDKGMDAQKAIQKQVETFFQEYGVSIPNERKDEVVGLLDDEEFLKPVRLAFEQKQQEKKTAAAVLRDKFPPAVKNGVNFSLMTRDRNDLYLGDLTNDCTAYHPKPGINQWTVPVWLANPGFNFMKIEGPKGEFIAKVGIVLALADGKPALVADSIEVEQAIGLGEAEMDRVADKIWEKEGEEGVVRYFEEIGRKEQRAVTAIREGFSFLGEWAKKNGLANVFVNRTSNSSELSQDLTSITESLDPSPNSLRVLGGLEGIREVREKLGGEAVEEEIYLQAVPKSGDLNVDTTVALNYIETFIERTRYDFKSRKDQRIMEQLARNAMWDELFAVIVHKRFPDLEEAIGNSYYDYQYHSQSDSYEFSGDRKDFTSYVEEFIKDNPKYNKQAYRMNLQADLASGLLESLEKCRAAGLEPTDILQRLYGTVAEDSHGNIPFINNLRVLKAA